MKAHEILIAIFSSLYPDYGAIGIPDENSMVDLEPLSRESAISESIFAHWPYSFNLRMGKTAIMNGQTLTKAFINLPGGGTAKSGSVRHRRRLGLFDRNIGGYPVGLDDPRYVDHALEGVHVAITPR